MCNDLSLAAPTQHPSSVANDGKRQRAEERERSEAREGSEQAGKPELTGGGVRVEGEGKG